MRAAGGGSARGRARPASRLALQRSPVAVLAAARASAAALLLARQRLHCPHRPQTDRGRLRIRIAKYGKPLPRLLAKDGLREGRVRRQAQPGDGGKDGSRNPFSHRRRLNDRLRERHTSALPCFIFRFLRRPQMTPADLARFEPQRRYATLVALAVEGMATVTDEIIDLHDRILGKLFNAARNKHTAAVPGIGQGDQRQGAPVRTHRAGAHRRQAIGR